MQIRREEEAHAKQVAADLAEVNRVRTDKKISTPEMIAGLPSSAEGTSADSQIRVLLKTLQVQVTTYTSPVPNVSNGAEKLPRSSIRN